jgi:hypothetical protein
LTERGRDGQHNRVQTLSGYLKGRQGELLDTAVLGQLRALQRKYEELVGVEEEMGKKAQKPPPEGPVVLSWEDQSTWASVREEHPGHQLDVAKLARKQRRDLAKNQISPAVAPILERASLLAAEFFAENPGLPEDREVAAAIRRRAALAKSWKWEKSPREALAGVAPI